MIFADRFVVENAMCERFGWALRVFIWDEHFSTIIGWVHTQDHRHHDQPVARWRD